MTALSEYQRLEAAGVWRASPDAQSINVFVSIGDATLTISDSRDKPLTHWSLAAIDRANPGKTPAIYHPNGDTGETLELPDDATAVIEAIEKLRTAVSRARPHPGRLRLVIMLASFSAVAAAMTLWLPDALRNHAANVLPQVKRDAIGQELRTHLERVTGPACNDPSGKTALTNLTVRLQGTTGSGDIEVMRSGVRDAVVLPGGTILVNRALVEDHEEPDVLAGFIIAERLREISYDPLADLLDHASIWDSTRLLTTGELPESVYAAYAEHLLQEVRPKLSTEMLLGGFQTSSVRARPYAYAVDITGETTLGLIEADPFARNTPPPLLSDSDWLRLQGICGS